MNKFILIFLILTSVIDIKQILSVCCYCKDWTFGYCGKGSCNIFGCNCDGGCGVYLLFIIFIYNFIIYIYKRFKYSNKK